MDGRAFCAPSQEPRHLHALTNFRNRVEGGAADRASTRVGEARESVRGSNIARRSRPAKVNAWD
jgi:hypothetical protein